jgi:hypothetical protein
MLHTFQWRPLIPTNGVLKTEHSDLSRFPAKVSRAVCEAGRDAKGNVLVAVCGVPHLFGK